MRTEDLPRVEFLGLGQSSEAGEQERRQVLRLILSSPSLTSSLTHTSPAHHNNLEPGMCVCAGVGGVGAEGEGGGRW